MALKTLVKISNVTNLSDARYCAGMGDGPSGSRWSVQETIVVARIIPMLKKL